MNKKEKIVIIFRELKKYNSEEFNDKEIINASKDLINYSQNDYVDKNSLTKNEDSVIIPIDEFILKNTLSNKNRYWLNSDDEEMLFESEKRDFNLIEKAA